MNEKTPSIIEAAYKNSISLAMDALKVDPSSINRFENGKTALHVAVSFGNASMVKFLLEQDGIDVSIKDSQGRDALDLALIVGHEEATRDLFRFRADEMNRLEPAQIVPFKGGPKAP